ncbi:MAG: response regulator [Ignavibacteriae bacterium]|nr:response regulator [Ignavibacteriota bacterium]
MAHTADILVVDDERVILDAVSKICSLEGYRVAQAPEASVAAHMLESGTYGLMLCDIMMPQMDGFQLLEIARKRAPGMPVIMATGYSTVENAVRSLREGAIDFVPKPFTSDELLSAVGRAVRYRTIAEALHAVGQGPADPALLIVPCPPKYQRLGYASWVVLEDGGTALIGLTHLFLRILERIDALDLQPVNAEIAQGTTCAQVRTPDGLSHSVLAPVSGRIVEVNPAATPDAIEKDPYFAGWLYRCIPSDVDYEMPQLTPFSAGTLF